MTSGTAGNHLPQYTRSLEAIHYWHAKIQHDQVWPETASFLNRLTSVFHYRANVKIWFTFKDFIKRRADKCIVIRDQNCVPHRRCLSVALIIHPLLGSFHTLET